MHEHRATAPLVTAVLAALAAASGCGESERTGGPAPPGEMAPRLHGAGVVRHSLPPGVVPESVTRRYVRALRLDDGRCRFDESPDTLPPGESVRIFVLEHNPRTCEFVFGRAPTGDWRPGAVGGPGVAADTVRFRFGAQGRRDAPAR